MNDEQIRVSEVFLALVDLAEALGASPMNQYKGCWEFRIDEQWELAINGHRHPIACSHGTEVPPFSAYVQYNGWPAGLLDPSGGILAAGEAANEETFLAAVRKRTAAARAAAGETANAVPSSDTAKAR